ncbi:hypothetical protein JTE90_011918 [Oedothorax gibbosus]|uniref:Uncharacterized protein n=1 Tax=Oedothorax gibbosus TaxID=931172 RepID=A0AAV6V0G4_9ARAC|nr:hypothetical protein JTE90_011918 [Oedothorax gibbosus]
MKVSLAVQVFSTSVAEALKFVSTSLKMPQFNKCSATVEFITLINDLFDICNSKNCLGKGLKGALKESNKKVWEPFLKNAPTYLLQLKDAKTGKLLYQTRRRTPILGFICLIKSLQGLFQDLVFSSKINYLTAYKMSQDHLEMFFSKVRLRGGWNNNPTPIQFKSAYKQLLVKNDIRANDNANVRPQKGDISSLACLSAVVPEVDESLFHNVTLKRLFDFDMDFEEDEQIQQETDTHIIYSDYKNNIVVYISGFVVRRASKKNKCQQCIASLESDATAIKKTLYF